MTFDGKLSTEPGHGVVDAVGVELLLAKSVVLDWLDGHVMTRSLLSVALTAAKGAICWYAWRGFRR
jgi:hypothetical protein